MNTKLEEAIKLVFIAHKNQRRRNINIEFSYHPITVGFMLKEYGCRDEVVIAGLLHDLIEDTDYDYKYIFNKFGKEVADMVITVTEDNTIEDYRERKTAFIENIKKANDEIILIEFFDKLHNLLSDYETFLEKNTYDLSSNKYEDVKWFYLSFLEIFEDRIKDQTLINRYKEIINLYFPKKVLT